MRLLCWLPAQGPGQASSSKASHLLLVSTGGGSLQVWRVPLATLLGSSIGFTSGNGSPTGPENQQQQQDAVWAAASCCRLVGSVAATHRSQDCLTALCLDGGGRCGTVREGTAEATGEQQGCCRVWVGDSSGHVALLGLDLVEAAGVCAGAGAGAGTVPTTAAAQADAVRLAHWRACAAPVVSLQPVVAVAGAAGLSGPELLLVGGQDATIGLWTCSVRPRISTEMYS